MLIFINGKIGYGSPPAGEVYWTGNRGNDRGFIQGAINFFNDSSCYFYDSDHGQFSTAKQRFINGFSFADWLFKEEITEHAQNFHFITLSMGAAFAEGMISYMNKKGLNVKWVVHVNPFQANDIKVKDEKGRITVDYQLTDDPVINNVLLKLIGVAKPGTITGATYKLREHSGFKSPLICHRSPLWHQGEKFWLKLKLQTAIGSNLT